MEEKRSSWPDRLTTVLACLWLALFPLWQDLSYSHITRAKWIGALALGSISVAAVLIACGCLAVKKKLRQHVRLHPVQLVGVVYFAWVALSAWQGRLSDAVNSRGEVVVWMGAVRYEGLLTQLCYGAIFLSMSLFRPRMRPVMTAAAAALMIFAAVVALQYAGMNPLGLYPSGRSIYTNYEFQGTIGNIDMVSGYLCLVAPLLLGGFVLAGKGGWLWLAAGWTGVLLECCMEVQSGLIAMAALAGLIIMVMMMKPGYRFRGMVALAGMCLCAAVRGMLCLPWLDGVDSLRMVPSAGPAALAGAGAILLGLAAVVKRHPGRAVPGRITLLLAIICIELVLLALMLCPVPSSSGGLWEIHEILQGRPQDQFGSWRLGVWRHTMDMSRESLLFGTGPDTFLYAMHQHLAEVGATLGENFDNPHNEYLAILSNNGLPALLAYLALLGTVVVLCVRHTQRRRKPQPWALAAALICYAVQGFFSFSICIVAPMFWAVMGLGVAHAAGTRERQATGRAEGE